MNNHKIVGFVLFPDFEVLDVFGPLEMFGLLPDRYTVCTVSESGGNIRSAQGTSVVADYKFSDNHKFDILMVPGGRGTREQVNNSVLLQWLANTAPGLEFVASVCTGSALLAKAGLLNGYCATSNKGAFNWVESQGEDVNWIKQARWVEDGRFFTSSGVSAGIDMSLALIAKISGNKTAEQTAVWAEYDWHKDSTWDPFAKITGLVD